MDQIEHLALCPRLRQLTLDGNPLQYGPDSDPDASSGDADGMRMDMYQLQIRAAICEILPNLWFLDDIPIPGKERFQNPQFTYTPTTVSRKSLKSGGIFMFVNLCAFLPILVCSNTQLTLNNFSPSLYIWFA